MLTIKSISQLSSDWNALNVGQWRCDPIKLHLCYMCTTQDLLSKSIYWEIWFWPMKTRKFDKDINSTSRLDIAQYVRAGRDVSIPCSSCPTPAQTYIYQELRFHPNCQFKERFRPAILYLILNFSIRERIILLENSSFSLSEWTVNKKEIKNILRIYLKAEYFLHMYLLIFIVKVYLKIYKYIYFRMF